MSPHLKRIVLVLHLAALGPIAVHAGISYEGRLTSAGLPANGLFDFKFRLYDGAQQGRSEQIGAEVVLSGVEVSEGLFQVSLDFGSEAGAQGAVWLEIEVARGDRLGGFTLLSPRQQLTLEGPEAAVIGIASGAVVFFDRPECPTGWSVFSLAQGRAIVGLQPGGVLQGTVGAPLSNQENRLHSHSFSPNAATGSSGRHSHIWSRILSAGGDIQWQTFDNTGNWSLAFVWGDGIGNDGSGVYPMAAAPGNTFYTESTGGHSHIINNLATFPSGGTLPYLQLLACQKD